MGSEQVGKMPAGIRMGPVALTVNDGPRAEHFYSRVLGLQVLESEGATIALGTEPAREIVRLVVDPQARPATGTTGLFHMAVRVPDRVELARSLQRIAGIEWPLEGVADHGVSEALYLSDPEGNGIEIYRDRPRAEWPWRNGNLEMTTQALDLNDLLGELSGLDRRQVEPARGAELGHVHLRVDDIPAAEDFYVRVMGFDLMQRYGRQASFVAAGGYHHHIGFNTWRSAGAPRKPTGTTGLRYYGITMPSEEELQALLSRLEAAGHSFQAGEGGWSGYDPAGNGILLKA